jgi:hypothetical protein
MTCVLPVRYHNKVYQPIVHELGSRSVMSKMSAKYLQEVSEGEGHQRKLPGRKHIPSGELDWTDSETNHRVGSLSRRRSGSDFYLKIGRQRCCVREAGASSAGTWGT